MCRFKSGIITRELTYCPWDTERHEEMIDRLKLDDSTRSPDFVRVELTPCGDKWWKNIDGWKFNVDQDYLPDWWNAAFAEQEMKNVVVGKMPLVSFECDLDLRDTGITSLPDNLSVGGEIYR